MSVDAVQEQPGHDPWWSVNRPVSARSRLGSSSASAVVPDRPAWVGSRWPAMSASSMARPETPVISVATEDSLMPASSSSFSSRCTSRVRSR